MLENEKIYFNNSNIKYIFEEADINCDKLIVIFSGYATNTSTIQHKYNYMNSLQHIKCHKLFILDDNGKTGSYYIGEKLNFNVETSIISLILDVTTYLGISVEDIISLGSSKGGTAALYYGLKYKFGSIIAGAFQTKISDLITERRPESEEFLLGDKRHSEYNENYKRLNNIIFDQLNSSIKSNMYFLTSENDWQYKTHILPFIQYLNEIDIEYYLEKSEEMKNHSQISTYFPNFFNQILLKILYGIKIENINIVNQSSIVVNADYKFDGLYKINVVSKVDGQEYLHDKNGSLLPHRPGHYSTYIVIMDYDNTEMYRYFIKSNFNGAGYYDILETTAKIENDELSYEVKTTHQHELTYAFYIYENDEMLEFVPYQMSNLLQRKVNSKNTYTVKCYIKSKDGSKVVLNDSPTYLR